jgi:carbonic anhydrase
MASLTQQTPTSNPHITSLQKLFADQTATLDWLVIAHNDPIMSRRLADVVQGKRAAMLNINQADWDLGGTELPEAVEWSIDEAGVQHLLIVGHSQADARAAQVTWMGDHSGMPESQPQTAYDRLLAGANRFQAEIQQAKDHFAEQIEHLSAWKELHDAMIAGRLQLHALFYLAPSGTFLIYEPASRVFKPIA